MITSFKRKLNMSRMMGSVGLLDGVMLNSNPISCEWASLGLHMLLSWFCTSCCCWQTCKAVSLHLLTGCLSIRNENKPFGSMTFSYFVYRRSQIMAVDAQFVFTAVVPELPSDCQPSEGAKMSQTAALARNAEMSCQGQAGVQKCFCSFLSTF